MERKEAYKFTSTDAENYDRYLGPVLFEPYGQYLASQIANEKKADVLELACGTGRVTQFIAKTLPDHSNFWATDISGDMLAIAKRRLSHDKVRFQTEDIQNLSFSDGLFDVAICQFGMMFLADKPKGFTEIARVLKPDGKLMCFTWDSTLNNPLFRVLINTLMLPYFADEDTARLFVPFSLYDRQQLTSWMKNAGFSRVNIETIELNTPPVSVEHLVNGFYLKHPLGQAMREKAPLSYEEIGQKFREELDRLYGPTPSIPMSALFSVGIK